MAVGTRYAVPRLKEARERRAITSKQLSDESDVAVSSLSRLENGHHLAFASTVQKLARALDVSVNGLRGLEPMPWDQPWDQERLPGIERPAA